MNNQDSLADKRKLIIETLTQTFSKVTRDRLPQHVTGKDCAELFPSLFNKDFFLVSKATLVNKVKKAKSDNEKELLTALWWSVTSNANPYKMSVSTMFFWDTSQQDLFKAIDKLLTPVASFLALLEKDRAKLSALGAW